MRGDDHISIAASCFHLTGEGGKTQLTGEMRPPPPFPARFSLRLVSVSSPLCAPVATSSLMEAAAEVGMKGVRGVSVSVLWNYISLGHSKVLHSFFLVPPWQPSSSTDREIEREEEREKKAMEGGRERDVILTLSIHTSPIGVRLLPTLKTGRLPHEAQSPDIRVSFGRGKKKRPHLS